MERVTSKLIAWKVLYDELGCAQAALLDALRQGASDHELDALRLRAARLHAESEAALKEQDEQVARFRHARPAQH